jgi:hypothetical protein
LDVFEPSLQSIPNQSFTTDQLSFLTAAIIEMGIINCTHVIAVMTPNTRGTQWVPYEYGRITDSPIKGKACAWKHPQLIELPEYMYLGELTTNEIEIQNWFIKEYDSMKSNFPECNNCNVEEDYAKEKKRLLQESTLSLPN